MNEQKRKPVGILLTVILIVALLTVCLEMGLGYLRPDIPGSIPKHLIHFGIMFALLGGAVLLCLFCPPFKKLWAWIDEHILDKETRPIAIDIIYAVIAGLMLLHHFYVILYYPTLPTGATKFAPVWLILAAVTVLLGKSWRNISFRLATIFLIYSFERLFFKQSTVSSNDMVYFASAIYSFFICLGSFSAIRPSIRKTFLKTLCAIWSICSMVLCFAGLISVQTGIGAKNLADTTVYLFRGRLSIFALPTITSSYLGCGIVMALLGLIVTKNKFIKLLYVFVCMTIVITNSLTDSRSSFIMISFIISGLLCIGLWTVYRNRKPTIPSGRQTSLIIALLAICFAACFFVTIKTQHSLGIQFINSQSSGGVIISVVNAENPNAESLPESNSRQLTNYQYKLTKTDNRIFWVSEGIDINKTLSDRLAIWTRALNSISENPQILIYGVSIDNSIATIILRQDHSHNILLQHLLQGGIPALLLYLSLVFYGIFHAFRLWNRRGVPFWQRILPLPVFSILLWEMAECLSHFSFGHPPMTLFWFFLGATITVSKSLGKAPKTAEQPAIPAESAVTETGE